MAKLIALCNDRTRLFSVLFMAGIFMAGIFMAEWMLARSQGMPPVDVEPIVPIAVVPGLDYAYYEIDTSLESQTPRKLGTVGNFDISLNERDTDYAFRFSGYIQISAANVYTFVASSTDTVRIVIGGQTVVTHGGDGVQSSTGSIDLSDGYYTLQVDYSHADHPAPYLEVSWSSIDIPLQSIPNGLLFRDDPSVTPTATSTVVSSATPTATSLLSDGGTTTFLPTSTPTATPIQTIIDRLDQRLYLPSLLISVSDSPSIFFANLTDGATVTSPFDIEMATLNFDIESAGSIRDGAGHFHLMVDVPCVVPGQQIPSDSSHRHYGDGATKVTLDLPVGEHALCLQAGNGGHTALDLTEKVTITVVGSKQRVSFSQPASGTVLNGKVDVRMAAENFVIEPPGAELPGYGHYHIMIDTPCIDPGNEIPRDEAHLHFGQGQIEATLDLAPGIHTLCLQAGTGFHTALGLTQIITLTVQPEPLVTFIQPQNGTIVPQTVQVEMGAVNFTIEPEGEAKAGAGHFHLMVDVPCVEVGFSIPADDNHKHYGAGQLATVLDLSPGPHTLCLQAGNGLHNALPMTDTIDITIAGAYAH